MLTRSSRVIEVARISTASGAVQNLKSFHWGNPRGFSLSPDGNYMLYHHFPTEEAATRDLYVLSTSDGSETTLIKHPADDLVFGWAPDGTSVLFLSDRSGDFDLYAIPVDVGRANGDSRLIKRNLGRVNPLGISSSGELYYGSSTGTNFLYSVSLDLDKGAVSGEPSLIETIGEGFTTGPAWSPDGKILAYTVQTSNGYNASWTLVLKDAENDKERRLPLAVSRNRRLEPVWAPDGQSLLVAARDRRNRNGLFRIDPQTGSTENLTLTEGPVFSAVWAPDGKSIFYVIGPHDDRRLMEHGLETCKEQQLLSGTYFQPVAVAPNGNSLAVAFQDAIWVMSIGDRSFREVLKFPDDSEEPRQGIQNIAWADTGTRLLFTRVTPTGTSLWKVDVNTGSTKSLNLTMEGLSQGGLSVRPEGRSVVFHASGEKEPIGEVWQLKNVPMFPSKLVATERTEAK